MARAVRNIRPTIGGTRPIPIHHIIPPPYSAIYKVELVDSDDVTYDITDYLDEGEYSDGVTDSIGSFEFKILDPNKTYSDFVVAFDYVNIYMDYGSSATTLRFKGVIEKAGREEMYFQISGRSIGMVITGKSIIYAATNTARSDVIKEILTDNFPDINQDNIADDDTEITVNYTEAFFQTIIEDLCGSHHDFYIDANSNARYFVRNSINNETEAIAQDINHLETQHYGEDSEETITKVRVYGYKNDELPIYSTSNSDTSITNSIKKEVVLNVSSALTTKETTEIADSEFSSGNSIKTIGTVTSLLLPTLAPGEKLKMAIPIDKIAPDYYEINSYVHNLVLQETTVVIQKRKLNIPKLIKKNVVGIGVATEKDNLYDLDFSVAVNFDVSSGTFSNTKITSNYLTVASGTSGTWTSDTFTFDSNLSKVLLLGSVANFIGSVFAYSFDGGLTYSQFGNSPAEPTGANSLIIKITLNSADAYVKGFVYQYSL